jgi:hypothetical protein
MWNVTEALESFFPEPKAAGLRAKTIVINSSVAGRNDMGEVKQKIA